MSQDIFKLRREEYAPKVSWFSVSKWVSASSDSWIPSWEWYGGIALVSAGVIFLGYKLITDPYSIAKFITPNKSGRRGGSTGAGPDIRLDDATTGAAETSAAGAARAGEAAEGLAEGAAEAVTSWFTPLGGLRYLGSSVLGFQREAELW